jgi:predicted Fe-Mo cluster-binding NifX family protein
MAEAILDCQVLLAGGMGWGAYEAMQGYGIETIATDVENIDEAVELYLAGKLAILMDRLH